MLLKAGDQVPVTPFVDVVGKGDVVSPEQMVCIAGIKTGTNGFTAIFTVVLVAHCPGIGVKRYVPEFELLTKDGFQVPTIPLFETVGKTGDVSPLQIDVGKVNFGSTLFTTKIVNANELAHCPGSGVKT